DFRLQRLNEFRKDASQAVLGELLLDRIENVSRDPRGSLRLVQNSGLGRQFFGKLLSSGRGHFEYPPIIGTGFQSPKVFWPVELCAEPETLSVGLAENHVSRSLLASSAVQAQGASSIQFQREAERTPMGVDHQRLTDLGELGIGLHAGDENGNLDGYP
ncbi:MAG: hypothetical protein ABSF85_09440, partial [Terriglobales bacterium]